MEIETTAWSEFDDGGKATVEQILESEEGLRESQSVIQVGNVTIWVSSSEIEKS